MLVMNSAVSNPAAKHVLNMTQVEQNRDAQKELGSRFADCHLLSSVGKLLKRAIKCFCLPGVCNTKRSSTYTGYVFIIWLNLTQWPS